MQLQCPAHFGIQHPVSVQLHDTSIQQLREMKDFLKVFAVAASSEGMSASMRAVLASKAASASSVGAALV